MEAAGIETGNQLDTQSPPPGQVMDTLGTCANIDGQGVDTLRHVMDTPANPACCRDVASLPSDLQAIIAAWPTLPDALKAGILAMVQSATPKQ